MSEARVVLDAMGGDSAPEVPVAAALRAAIDFNQPVTLVGASAAIHRAIGRRSYPAHLIEIVDAPEHVSMEDEAIAAIRRKRRASIPVALELLRDGLAAAFVSAGNTGAVVAGATLGLGRLPGVARPGIAVPIPTLSPTPMLMIDAGALVDPKPEQIWQHARLGAAYSRAVADTATPSIGLVSNGEEAGKGNALGRAAFELLSNDPQLNFVGNIEPRAIPDRPCDVLVTDGFTGNIILKTGEGVVALVQGGMRRELTNRWYRKFIAGLLRPALRSASLALDYREFGGAPLLGVEGLVYIAHGSSDERALSNAILAAASASQGNVLATLRSSISAT